MTKKTKRTRKPSAELSSSAAEASELLNQPLKTRKSQITVPLLRLQLGVLAVVVAVMSLMSVIAWQYWQHQKLQADWFAQEQVIFNQRTQINELLVELDDQLQQQVALKADISTAGELLADQNLSMSLLDEEVTRLTGLLADRDKQLKVTKSTYQRNLSSQLKREKARLRSSEQALAQEKQMLAAQEAAVKSKMGDVSEWEKKKAEFDKLYASSALEVENEKRIDKLMAQFNSLRVDLNVVNECDKDYLYRYNEAKSVLNHIRTFIQKYEMKQEYYFYVISNDSQITSQNRRLCLKE
ncbi:hypothetical protein A3K86_14625 [Photobacterium jeanii]|uniref:Uncharacterized protein n=1 Tax=Photobacterium jeanii TaxID=858640 RepID=A0A178K8Y6_9GAMM|nr:hypothetical protein [Photobacterium jeanii]OAN13791.1 hypothetical protein A3K86_14625 [Photobacterium jeanii]PST92748.1 hypothetical protein C9I91_06175 [Photobacterium jeanii]